MDNKNVQEIRAIDPGITHKVTRKNFLEGILLGLGLYGANKIGLFDSSYDKAEKVGVSPLIQYTLDKIPEEIPPMYVEREIPKNETYKKPDVIIVDALRLYMTRQKKEGKSPMLWLQLPKQYLSKMKFFAALLPNKEI